MRYSNNVMVASANTKILYIFFHLTLFNTFLYLFANRSLSMRLLVSLNIPVLLLLLAWVVCTKF